MDLIFNSFWHNNVPMGRAEKMGQLLKGGNTLRVSLYAQRAWAIKRKGGG